MKAYGAPLLERFAEHLPEAAGYSLVQLIETSAITGHFCDLSGDAYIDIFSCKDFSVRNTSTSSRSYAKPSRRAPATCSLRNTCLPRIEVRDVCGNSHPCRAFLYRWRRLHEALRRPHQVLADRDRLCLVLGGPALQMLAMKREDLAVTYLWVAGLESVLAFAFAVLLFSESCARARIAGVLLITGGIVSLRSAY